MDVSALDLFHIGLGPSSSHTVGPMRAAKHFIDDMVHMGNLFELMRLEITLYGSLALTGKGHGTDRAIALGLEGYRSSTVDPTFAIHRFENILRDQKVKIPNHKELAFRDGKELLWEKDKFLPKSSNAVRFKAFGNSERVIHEELFYSVGGGFILRHQEACVNDRVEDYTTVPYPFNTAREWDSHVKNSGLRLLEIVKKNELARTTLDEVYDRAILLWKAMEESIARGISTQGILPGGLGVKRRASSLYASLNDKGSKIAASEMDWASCYAIAVNEENAAGHRVVTAPTNGSSGVIPAVLHFLFTHRKIVQSEQNIVDFFLIAGAVGWLYKKNASLSGAEMGCQGEIGVASSMAAAAATFLMGGSDAQILRAAEIAMEHHLGLTCDPVGGLVQIPCIERNAMGAVKALTAMHLALRGDGSGKVSLDQVIETMRQTGRDMKEIYRETSLGGLALNVIEC